MWELDHKEGWALKNWCCWTVLELELVLEKILESPLDCKEIQPVNRKGNQCWIFIGRTDAEAESPILWPPDVKNWLIGKDPDAGKDWRQKGKGITQDEMVGWHHRLDGHEIEQAPGVGDGQESLMCCSPWGWKESNRTEGRNYTELTAVFRFFGLVKWTTATSWWHGLVKTRQAGQRSQFRQRPKIKFTYSLVFYHFPQATMSKNKYITCPFNQFS